MPLNELPDKIVADLCRDLDDVEGWLSAAEIELLFGLASKVAPIATIVEVGSWKGRSTIVLARALAARGGGTVHAIDPHRGVGDYAPDTDTFGEFLGNIERKGVASYVSPHRAASLDVAARWSEPLGMVWIDGSHEYEDVCADIRAWSEHLVPGGVIAIHDTTNWYGPGEAADRLVIKNTYFVGHGLVHYTIFARKQEEPRSIAQGLRARWVGLVRRMVSRGSRMHHHTPQWAMSGLRAAGSVLRKATRPRFLRR